MAQLVVLSVENRPLMVGFVGSPLPLFGPGGVFVVLVTGAFVDLGVVEIKLLTTLLLLFNAAALNAVTLTRRADAPPIRIFLVLSEVPRLGHGLISFFSVVAIGKVVGVLAVDSNDLHIVSVESHDNDSRNRKESGINAVY